MEPIGPLKSPENNGNSVKHDQKLISVAALTKNASINFSGQLVERFIHRYVEMAKQDRD